MLLLGWKIFLYVVLEIYREAYEEGERGWQMRLARSLLPLVKPGRTGQLLRWLPRDVGLA